MNQHQNLLDAAQVLRISVHNKEQLTEEEVIRIFISVFSQVKRYIRPIDRPCDHLECSKICEDDRQRVLQRLRNDARCYLREGAPPEYFNEWFRDHFPQQVFVVLRTFWSSTNPSDKAMFTLALDFTEGFDIRNHKTTEPDYCHFKRTGRLPEYLLALFRKVA